MRLVCLLASGLKLTPTPLVNLKTSHFDLKGKKLTGVREEPFDLPYDIVTYLKGNPDLLKIDGYLLSIESGKMSAKTLTRQFRKSLDSKFKKVVTLQRISSAGKKYIPTRRKEKKPVTPKPVQKDLFEPS